VIIILNKTSGVESGPDEKVRKLEGLLRDSPVQAEIWTANAGHALTSLARKAAESEHDTIVAGGGDGTINAVAGALVHSTKKLGILPLGTLNHFSKDLGVPVDLPGAVENLTQGRERSVDVAEVNGRYFLNNSSIGLYPRIVRHREQQREQLRRGKWPAFAWALLSALRVCPSLRLRITADGVTRVTRTPFLFIGNNAYRMDLLRIGARDHLDRGELSIYYAGNTGGWGVVALALRSLISRVEQARNFVTLSAREARIEARRHHLDVSADGEVVRMTAPLAYKMHPRALRVIAPPIAAEATPASSGAGARAEEQKLRVSETHSAGSSIKA